MGQILPAVGLEGVEHRLIEDHPEVSSGWVAVGAVDFDLGDFRFTRLLARTDETQRLGSLAQVGTFLFVAKRALVIPAIAEPKVGAHRAQDLALER